jgi:hypothetical protein
VDSGDSSFADLDGQAAIRVGWSILFKPVQIVELVPYRWRRCEVHEFVMSPRVLNIFENNGTGED